MKMKEDIIAIVCPDIHGRNFWEKAAEEYDGSVPFIFLGDYLDPYSDEGINDDIAKKNFSAFFVVTGKNFFACHFSYVFLMKLYIIVCFIGVFARSIYIKTTDYI